MRLAIEWSHVCETDVRRISWETASRICKAVLELAEGRPAWIERVRPGDPSLIRVRVRGAVALVRVDAESRTIFVWRMYGTR